METQAHEIENELSQNSFINIEDGVDNEKPNEENVQDLNEKDELKAGKPRSWVWEHFKWSKGIVTSECPYCHQILKCHSKINGTGGLKRHLEHHCSTSPVYKLKEKGDKRQSILGFKQTSKGQSTSGMALVNHSFSQEKCRMTLARMCIKDNRSFSLVDDEGFREFAWEMNPLFKIPSRWTVARDCLAIYREEAENVRKLLKNQIVSLTTDTWSSVQNINYMCLTAHWVDDEWVLRKKILNFCPITNHKGLTIGKLVYACLQKWGIDRVFTVTVDNASSNDGAIRYLKTVLRGPDAILDCKYLHLRCCAHIVNLVVRDGLEEQNLAITKIRNAVRYVRSSPAREASFRASVEKEKIDCTKKLCLDVETRWNSTYLMLKTAEKYAAAFRRLESVDYNFKAYFCDDDEEDCVNNTRKRRRRERIVGPPDASDWERARCFIGFLKLFYKVTNLISGSKFVTSNLFFSELVTMHASISRMCSSSDEYEKEMAMSMKVKYDKYWNNLDNINILLYVAVVLDPRNKMFYLNYCLGQIHGFQAPKVIEISDRVVTTLNELYAYYKKQGDRSGCSSMGSCSSSSSSFGGISTMTHISPKIDLESNFLRYMEEQGCVANKTEVEVYLSDGMEKRDDKFDILGWWKINAKKFPVLSKVAKYVLAMPISTVASESTFSTGGRVIDPFRSSLTPKTAEALICSQDWIRSSPTDIGAPVQVKTVQELQENLEKLEIDEFATGPKFFAPCMLDD